MLIFQDGKKGKLARVREVGGGAPQEGATVGGGGRQPQETVRPNGSSGMFIFFFFGKIKILMLFFLLWFFGYLAIKMDFVVKTRFSLKLQFRSI